MLQTAWGNIWGKHLTGFVNMKSGQKRHPRTAERSARRKAKLAAKRRRQRARAAG
jgi:hypothetical protein